MTPPRRGEEELSNRIDGTKNRLVHFSHDGSLIDGAAKEQDSTCAAELVAFNAGWNAERVTREEIIARIRALSEDEFERIAPWLVADLANVDVLDEIGAEIAAGRKSATTEPLVEHSDALARARRKLKKE